MNIHEMSREQLIAEVERLTGLVETLSSRDFSRLQDGILNNVQGAVMATDTDMKIIYWNRYSEIMHQYKAEEVLGKNIIDIRVPPENREKAKAVTASLIEKDYLEGEFESVRKDGSRFPTYIRTTAIKDRSGKVIGFVGIHVDITDRKKAEAEIKDLASDLEMKVTEIQDRYETACEMLKKEAAGRRRSEEMLRESEESMRLLLDNLPMHVGVISKGKYFIWNKFSEKMFGYKSAEVIGKMSPVDMHVSEEAAADVIRQASSRGKYDAEVMLKRKDSTEFPAHLVVVPAHPDASGDGVFYGIAMDTTMIRHSESRLRESESTLRAILNSSKESILLVDRSGNIVEINNASVKKIGLAREAIIGRNVSEFGPPEDHEVNWRHFEKVINSGTAQKFEGFNHGRICEYSFYPAVSEDGSVSAVAAYITDVTEKREFEEKLRISEQNYRSIFESVDVPILISDYECALVFDANRSAYEYFGVNSPEFFNRPDFWRGMNPPFSYEDGLEKWASVKIGGPQHFEWLTRNSKGEMRWVEVFVKIVEIGGKKTFISMFYDIHERKTFIEALKASHAETRKSDEIYRTLAESADQMIFMIDGSGIIKYVNQFAAKSYGLAACEIIGRKHDDLFTPEIAQRHNAQIKKVFETGKPIYSYDRMERMKNPDRIIWIDAMLVPVRDDEGNVLAVIGISRDITERKKLNEEIIRSSKLESLGTLAGGIAHDFNNVLMGIIGNLAMAKKRAPEDEKLYINLQRAEKIAYKAKNLTEQLITFSRGGAPVKKTMSLSELIRETALFATTGSNVECVFSLAEDLWPVEVDEGQITQVFTNIVINSQQAMPDGGNIVIRGENILAELERSAMAPAGKYVSISFSDSGCGISLEDMPRIFDPFFSKKETGKGLGLATAYSIIKRHSGTIKVESDNRGTTVTVWLPAADGSLTQEKNPIKTSRSEFFGCRVLVMDDDEAVLFPICDMLADLGCIVRSAINGEQAYEEFEHCLSHGSPFDVVILDLVVKGGMGGLETFKKIREINKDASVVVSSGYSNDPVIANYKDYGFCGALIKPYRQEQVYEILQDYGILKKE